MMDSDLQVNPESIKEMYDFSNLKESWDIISANRLTRSNSLRRQLGSKVISFLLQRIGKNKFKDIGSTYKLMKRKALDKILANDILVQNLPILIMNLNFKIIEFPIDYNQIQNRRSHYRVTDLLSAITLALLNFSTVGLLSLCLLLRAFFLFYWFCNYLRANIVGDNQYLRTSYKHTSFLNHAGHNRSSAHPFKYGGFQTRKNKQKS
jgi:hypothetical protein